MGNRGRLVVPHAVRMRRHWDEGTRLILLDTDDGVVLLTREQLRDRVRAGLAGRPLVDELLQERRREAEREDAT